MLKLYDDTNIKAIADAIRAKNGTSDTYKVSEMAQAIAEIHASGGTAEGGIIDGSVVSVDNDRVTFVREEAFYYCEDLRSVNLPNVTDIDDSAFEGCSALEEVNVPKLQTVGYSAFGGCEELVSIDLPEVTMIEEYAFDTCTALTNINMPKVETIASKAFQDCYALKKIYIPASCTTIDASSTYDSPFYGLYNNDLTVYCGADSKPDGWGEYWAWMSTSGTLPNIVWGVTPEEYATIE